MFSLLNFPYNLNEMMQDEIDEVSLASFEEKLKQLLETRKNLTRKELAAAMGLEMEQWLEWLKNAAISSGLKSEIENLPGG